MPSGSFEYEVEGLGVLIVEWEGTRGRPARHFGPDGGDPGDPPEITSLTVWFGNTAIDCSSLYIKHPRNMSYVNVDTDIHEHAIDELLDWEQDYD